MLLHFLPARTAGKRRSIAVAAALAITAGGHAVSAKTISTEGTLEPTGVVDISSHVSGIVQDVACDFNTTVRKGQICAKIDPRPFEAAVQQASAAVETAKAQLSLHEAALGYAKSSYERYTRLVKTDAVSRNSFENAQSNYEQLKSQVELDKALIRQRGAELDAARLNLGYTDIVAPFDGVVLAKRVGPGESVAASLQPPTLFVIANDLGRLHVNASLDEADVGLIQVNDEASFTVKAFSGRTFNAKVLQVRKSERTGNGARFLVVLEVDNKDMALKPGMTATVRISTRDK